MPCSESTVRHSGLKVPEFIAPACPGLPNSTAPAGGGAHLRSADRNAE